MRSRTLSRVLVAGLAAVAAAAVPSTAQAVVSSESKVSDHSYVRYDGGSDVTLAACSTNNRQQNEPAASVAPHNPNLITAGANDYCATPTAGDAWAGFYYSADRGASWTNSLVPGYSTDNSPAGTASPLHGLALAAGDPVQAWDNDGHLYYGGIAFNRSRPANGSIWVARYSWTSGAAPTYERTTLVSRGTPSPIFLGIFEDKVQLEVDRGASSPYQGNVYMCWARFTASAQNNGVYFAASSDGGRSFKIQKVSESVHGSQFCDIAVTRNGSVYVAWRQFTFKAGTGQLQDNAVIVTKSTNGGKKFSKPRTVTNIVGWDLSDQTVNAAAYGQARYNSCLAGDLGPGSCASPDPVATARSCGDGPFACQSGYTFFRANSQVRIAADPTALGPADAAYVVYDGSVPGSEVPTGTTYGTVSQGVGTQAAVYLTATNGGATWSAPTRVDAQAKGHQFFPDIVADSGRLHVTWQDSRADTATGPNGGDFRTVPIGNQWVASNPPGAVSSGGAVHTFYATAPIGGSFTVSQVSTVAIQPQYEQFGNRDTPFFGDYNYIAAAGNSVFMTWTDERDTVPGTDPRYPVDGTDGFDVHQCRVQNPDGSWGADTCPDVGGLDQNIYGAVVTG
ncbi:MAG: sialidase family protein [Micromonosporaceae bacterium]